jgi:uncharacterized membrane protein YfcA
MTVVTVLVGLLIGLLVGISGIGGAVMLLPLLILALKVPPLVAVGSDAVFATFTKMGAGAIHLRQKTVDLRLVLFLAIGSLPGAVVGFRGLAILRDVHGDGIDEILRTLIGVLLITIPLFMLAQLRILKVREAAKFNNNHNGDLKWLQTVLVGLVGGILVGLTSVGSGSVILVGLLLVHRRPTVQLIGTDIVHAILLTGLTGTMHYTVLDSVDTQLVAALLAGSIPGSMIGARLANRIPARQLQIGILILLLMTGVYLISFR